MMKKVMFRSGSLFLLLNLSSIAYAIDAPLPRVMRTLAPVVFEDPPPPAPEPPSHAPGIFKHVKFPGAVEDPPPPDK